ncbi:MAG: DNA polymerase III subunit gamma/tau [Candidatus Daviesbacteria bacterium]|nr:DNA polymerase III subunit gamma/tau [Candidatus Daviesbacteria bacterium]
MVLYRKYRSQTLEELIGQANVKLALKSALSEGKLAHAYLFYGPRGTGKTSTARILAKIVNCESIVIPAKAGIHDQESDGSPIRSGMTGKEVSSVPCNKCSSCLSITEGSNMDVIEMDAASNRGIDDIRSLRENIKLSPSKSLKKVYIIDEVHMLSAEAFNALLKTLEEPPSHVLFILATTELAKIPQTILSRVQKLEFKQASLEELKEAMSKVAKLEKIKIDDESLTILAKKAQGSFRDGIKLLDLLSTHESIDQKVIEENLGSGVFENIGVILENIAQKESSKALKNLTSEISKGVNIKELTLSFMDMLRQIFFIKHDLGESLVKNEVSLDKYKILESMAEKFEMNHLISTLDIFQKSLEQGRFASIASLPLEIAVVESAQSSQPKAGPSLTEVVSSQLSEKSLPVVSTPVNVIAIRQLPEKQSLDFARDKSQTEIATSPSHIAQDSRDDNSSDIQKIKDKWTYVLETIRAFNFSLEALLRSAKISECGESNMIIEVPYSFHQRILEAPKSRDLLESIFSDILGRSIKVSTVLGQKPVRAEELANVEMAADDEIIKIASEIFNSETVN